MPQKVEPPKKSWHQRLSQGLALSRQGVWGKIENIFTRGDLTDEAMEELEALLYGADLGTQLVGEMLKELRQQVSAKNNTLDSFKAYFYETLKTRMSPIQSLVPEELFDVTKKKAETITIMIVGVNGVGKTTTIGKLATRLSRQGAKVVVGACDTFRAAAVDQLEVWCQRAGAQMVRAKEGASPSGVGYETLKTALSSKADYCILDTAGRLHTKGNLMEELKKSKEVLAKLDPKAPHHVLLVLDAITGQNALRQAQEFHKTLGLTGLIFTKCDSSSKAGSAVGIVQELKVPIAYIGVGEDVEDLDRFVVEDYLGLLLNYGNSN
ncbi:MAG: signal recognition particle-docking protein FtsY [Bdellovibrionales bacterium GWA2_49_15]|nr:MAG: signal recognition particle-docking protein FtsY [Bdellovibrionales bacterium GWA2_49_15]